MMTTSTADVTLNKIEGFGPTEMLLEWSTGESYAIPYAEVRFFCPCAFCVDEATGRRKIKREEVQPGVKPLQAQQVGQYALKFWWTDRHNSGIYSFTSLHEICHVAGRLLQAGDRPAEAGAEQSQAAPTPRGGHTCGCGGGGCGGGRR